MFIKLFMFHGEGVAHTFICQETLESQCSDYVWLPRLNSGHQSWYSVPLNHLASGKQYLKK